MTRPGFSSSTIAFEDFRDRERLDDAVDLHEDAAVRAHRESRADRLGGLLRADRHGDDLGRGAFFLEPDRLFDSNLVEGIHRHLDVGELHPGAIRLDANLDVEIDHPLDGHQDFHAGKLPPRAAGNLWLTPWAVNAVQHSLIAACPRGPKILIPQAQSRPPD